MRLVIIVRALPRAAGCAAGRTPRKLLLNVPAPVERDHLGRISDAGHRVERALRDAFAAGFALERREPGVEARGIVAA